TAGPAAGHGHDRRARGARTGTRGAGGDRHPRRGVRRPAAFRGHRPVRARTAVTVLEACVRSGRCPNFPDVSGESVLIRPLWTTQVAAPARTPGGRTDEWSAGELGPTTREAAADP